MKKFNYPLILGVIWMFAAAVYFSSGQYLWGAVYGIAGIVLVYVAQTNRDKKE